MHGPFCVLDDRCGENRKPQAPEAELASSTARNRRCFGAMRKAGAIMRRSGAAVASEGENKSAFGASIRQLIAWGISPALIRAMSQSPKVSRAARIVAVSS
jgi:hypothetical protein